MSDRPDPDPPVVVVTTAAELRKLTTPTSSDDGTPSAVLEPVITERHVRVGDLRTSYAAC